MQAADIGGAVFVKPGIFTPLCAYASLIENLEFVPPYFVMNCKMQCIDIILTIVHCYY